MNKRNIEIPYNKKVAEKLKKLRSFSTLVIDTETTGNDTFNFGLLSLGAIDLFNPDMNFYGECHLRDNAQISHTDILKNKFGKDNNITSIINPQGIYPELRNPIRPFLIPNDKYDQFNELKDFFKILHAL